MSTDTKESLERRLGLALDMQGLLAAELKQMRAWRNKWRTRTREWRGRTSELSGAVRLLRSEVAETKAALTSAQAQAQRVEEALRAQLDEAQQATKRAHSDACDLRTQLDKATKRADLAEATLATVRTAVAVPQQDTRPKVGDRVHWSEAEAGALYFRPEHPYPFRAVTREAQALLAGAADECLPLLLRGEGNPLSELQNRPDGWDVSGVLIARDLGTDPEAWRAAMREHMAKVGK